VLLGKEDPTLLLTAGFGCHAHKSSPGSRSIQGRLANSIMALPQCGSGFGKRPEARVGEKSLGGGETKKLNQVEAGRPGGNSQRKRGVNR